MFKCRARERYIRRGLPLRVRTKQRGVVQVLRATILMLFREERKSLEVGEEHLEEVVQKKEENRWREDEGFWSERLFLFTPTCLLVEISLCYVVYYTCLLTRGKSSSMHCGRLTHFFNPVCS